jgi:hypothetical protein
LNISRTWDQSITDSWAMEALPKKAGMRDLMRDIGLDRTYLPHGALNMYKQDLGSVNSRFVCHGSIA